MSENIRVAVRARPFNTRERDLQCSSVVEVRNNREVRVSDPEEDKEPRVYTFDFAYDDQSTQEGVYTDLGAPVVAKALDGFNATIFAYGQTGSGKTHTMMGSPEMPGIIPRLNEELFGRVSAVQDESNKFLLSVSYLEIYNEVVKDLLNPSDKALQIRENPKTGIYVQDLAIILVRTNEDVIRLLEQGSTVRKVASTRMNATSSRSHSVFTIRVEQHKTEEIGDLQRSTALTSAVNLVDLAGSERAAKTGATGSTLKEGAMINKSLMTLGTVINKLSEAQKGAHIPYRDSKLTRLLQESLGGNSGTIMVAAISPADNNFDETLSTLKYANRAKSIQNSVVKNEDVNERMIRELKQEIEALRAQLARGGAAASVGNSEADEALRKRLDELERERDEAKNLNWEERERLARELEAERQRNLQTTITSTMDLVRQQKLDKMKAIKRLQNEKQQLLRKQRAGKDEYVELKTGLANEIASFQALQKQLEDLQGAEKEDVEAQMDTIITAIEEKKETMVDCRDQLSEIKRRLREVEDLLTEERANLVTQAELLDVNERMKEAVREEMKKEWEREREKVLHDSLKEEREKMTEEKTAQRLQFMQQLAVFKGKLQQEFNKEKELFEGRILQLEREKREVEVERGEMAARISELEGRVADSEVDLETTQEETETLRKELLHAHETIAQLNNQYEGKIKQVEAKRKEEVSSLEALLENREEVFPTRRLVQKGTSPPEPSTTTDVVEAKEETKEVDPQQYQMFESLMDLFEDERAKMQAKYDEKVALLNDMVKDVMYLTKRNEELEEHLRNLS